MKRVTFTVQYDNDPNNVVEYQAKAISASVWKSSGAHHMKWDLIKKGAPHEERPCYHCDKCGAMVAWFKSERTGKLYLCDVFVARERWGSKHRKGVFLKYYFQSYKPHFKTCGQSTEDKSTTNNSNESETGQ